MEYGHKLRQQCKYFTNFQTFLKEKDRNLHLNDKFSLKIAQFPVNEMTNFYIFSMHKKIGWYLIPYRGRCKTEEERW